MIKVVGKKAGEAKKILKNYGLTNVKVEYVYTSAKDDVVVKQSIPEGQDVSANTFITIYVNVHADTVKVPNLIGKTAEEADNTLNSLNITDIVIKYEKSFYPAGTVIYQSIKAGEEILKGRTIELVISEEVESLKMKDFFGKAPEEAKEWFERVGIEYRVGDQVDPTQPSGVIISQSVPMYSEVYKGEVVYIFVNKYVPVDTDVSQDISEESSEEIE